MKKAVIAAFVTSVALAASAHSRSTESPHLGTHGTDAVTPTESVPESSPPLALALVSAASIGLAAAFVRGKKSRA